MADAEQTGNPVKLEAAFQMGVKMGVFSPSALDKPKETAFTKMEMNIYAKAIEADPWNKDIRNHNGARNADGSEYKITHLGDDAQLQLDRLQIRMQETQRGSMLRQLDRYAEDPNNPRTPGAIIAGTTGPDGKPMTVQDIVNKMDVDGKWLERWMKTGVKYDDKVAIGLRYMLGNVNPKDYDEKTEQGAANITHMEYAINTSGLPTSMKDEWMKQFHSKLNEKPGNGEITSKSIVHKELNDAWDSGDFLPFVRQKADDKHKQVTRADEDYSKGWETMVGKVGGVPRDLVDIAQKNYNDAIAAVDQVMSDGKEHSPQELRDSYQKILEVARTGKIAAAVKGVESPPQEALDILRQHPEKASYFDKRWGVKLRRDLQQKWAEEDKAKNQEMPKAPDA
jgi:hypothetical protein